MSQRTAISDTSQTPSVTDGLTPASTPSETPIKGAGVPITSLRSANMDEKLGEKPKEQAEEASQLQEQLQPSAEGGAKTEKEKEEQPEIKGDVKKSKSGKKVCRKSSHKKRKATKKAENKKAAKDASESDSSEDETESDTDSDSSDDDKHSKRKSKKSKSKKVAKDKKRRKSVSESDDSDTDESEDEKPKKKSKTKHSKKSSKDKKKRKAKAAEAADSSDSESSDDSSSEEETPKRKKKASKKSKKTAETDDSGSGADSDAGSDGATALQAQIDALKLQMAEKKVKVAGSGSSKKRRSSDSKSSKKSGKSKSSKGSSAYQRVDQLWSTETHNFTLKPSAEEEDDEYAEHAFLVRRCFNWENKYMETVVDIKSKQLRAVLAEVMKDCKSVSLEAEEPCIDPNTLFLYLEELRKYYRKTLKEKIKKEKKKRKNVKKLDKQRSLCKALVGYIDEDYEDTKKTLYPLLEAGNITFDLMWALFKPNEMTVTSCYGSWEHPRCFKVEYATKCCNMQRGDWYAIEGKYLEYDGKAFGFGDFEIDIDGFKGPRKITSLAAYPLKYHKDQASIKAKIMERGEKFIGMEGMQYKFHKGLAFLKKKKAVAKINTNGRIMVDPATFRRINPNYPIAWIKPKEDDDLFSMSDDDDDCSCCGQNSDDEGAHGENKDLKSYDPTEDVPKFKYKWAKNSDGLNVFISVEVDENGDPIRNQKIESLAEVPDAKKRSFSEEELLLTSPVVLGFSFADKLWLEFSLSSVTEIEYNESAFDSLVLPDNQKEIVRALVESHKFNAAKTIDDVVQGKGKGLVSVLHGPPGTGKTLTAEGISELLKCPLYMVSAGELGTDPGKLEYELQKILDIAHSWGAVLLLDEADVFLEKREVHDIHRNALVSIFLRLLEYFQGILFLTTNRVDTFDEAFQSRIHLPLRYGELTSKAKKTVWKMFFEVVRKTDPESIVAFSDHDLEMLSRHQLNGRQIKNAVRTAQALALKEKKTLCMQHVTKVLDVSETFDRDLKGGTGYLDAMRNYV